MIWELRSLPGAGQLPIGLLAPDGHLEVARRLADQHDAVLPFPRPHTDEAMAEIAARLGQMAGRDLPSADERAQQAVWALEQFADLLARRRTFYDLRSYDAALGDALLLTDKAAPSIKALQLLGTPSSQQLLVDYASQAALPIEARRAASEAFRQSVQRNGLLLEREEILRQYERYNASETADVATQELLGGLLDSIESRRAAHDRQSLELKLLSP